MFSIATVAKDKYVSSSATALAVILIFSTAIILFSLSFLFVKFNALNKISKTEEITETVSIVYADDMDGIRLDNSKILSDELAAKSTEKHSYFDFDIASKLDSSNVTINYEVALFKSSDCNLDSDNIIVYVEKQNDGTYSKVFKPKVFSPITKDSVLGATKGSMILFSGKYVNGITDKYRLRVWVNDQFVPTTPIKCDLSVKLYADGKHLVC